MLIGVSAFLQLYEYFTKETKRLPHFGSEHLWTVDDWTKHTVILGFSNVAHFLPILGYSFVNPSLMRRCSDGTMHYNPSNTKSQAVFFEQTSVLRVLGTTHHAGKIKALLILLLLFFLIISVKIHCSCLISPNFYVQCLSVLTNDCLA